MKKNQRMMKRVYNGSDIKFSLSELRIFTDNFRIKFFTTNKDFYVQKTMEDVDWNEEDDSFIKLSWNELKTIGNGVLNYILYTYETDEDYEDGRYDHSYSRTTFYPYPVRILPPAVPLS